MTTSIIIPSRNRVSAVRNCLRALAAQTTKPEEVLLIENNDVLSYQSVTHTFPSLPLRLILEKRLGKSWARNGGLSEAHGDLVVFLDDDCIPKPRWLAEIKKTYRQHPNVDVLLGGSREQSLSTLMKAYSFQYDRWFFNLRIHKTSGEVICGGALNSRNFAVKRSFLRGTHLKFDNQYDRFGFAEDTDFGEQLENAGAKMIYSPRAVVTHQGDTSLTALLLKKFANGRAMYHVSRKGIFHSFQKKKKGVAHKIRRVLAVTRELSPDQKLMFIVYLYLIVAAYHAGIFFEHLISQKPHRHLPGEPPRLL